MTLTAVFAPGVSAVGGGEDVAKVIQVATEAAGVKWLSAGQKTATHTIIILTGALLASPSLAKQVCPCPATSPSLVGYSPNTRLMHRGHDGIALHNIMFLYAYIYTVIYHVYIYVCVCVCMRTCMCRCRLC